MPGLAGGLQELQRLRQARPQSVFALQKELARETERRYSKLTLSERLKLQLEGMKAAKA